MAKPVITFRSDTDPLPLTYNELDTNFLNLRDSTINFTGDAGDTRSMDLNDATAITGERNIRVTVDEATQSIKIRNTLSDYTTDPNGFENRTDSTISFNTSTRVFTIAPSATDYEIWNQGQQYTISTNKTVTVPNTTGIYLVYFDGSTLSVVSGAEPVWTNQTPVSYVYWNSATSAGLFTDERHGIRMDAATKEYLHETSAMAYAEGFLASNYTTSGDGSSNTHAELDIGNGVCYDQDIRVEITHSNTPTANTWEQDLQGPARIPVVYHSSSTGAWTIDAARDYPLKNGTSLVTYNLNSAGTWTTPDCTSTYYVAYWIVATNILNSPIIAVMGQRQDNKLSDAIANNTWNSLDLTYFPAEEFRPLYRILVRTASGYANTPKAYFAQIDDFRQSAVSPAGSISAVNAFTTISVAGQTDITADTATDALTLVAGTGITLTTDPATDSLTIASAGTGTVNSGVANRLAFYPSTGTTVDDTSIITVNTGTNTATLNNTLQIDGRLEPSGGGGSGTILIGASSNGTISLANNVGYPGAYRLVRITKSGVSGNAIGYTSISGYGPTVTNASPYIEEAQILVGPNQTAFDSGGTGIRLVATTVFVDNGKLQLGLSTNSDTRTITTSGTSDLVLNTNNGTNSGSITIANGANNDITIAPNGTGVIFATKTISSTVAHGQAAIDTVDTDASYANNATVDFADFSGLIIVNNTGSTGQVMTVICGGGSVAVLGYSGTGTPHNTGTITAVSGINGYRWTNDTGATDTFSFAAIQTRAAG